LRNDLIFIGIPEHIPTEGNDVENCTESLTTFIKERLQSDPELNPDNNIDTNNIVFTKVGRVGQIKGKKPRPVLVTFDSTEAKELIRSAGVTLNSRKGRFYINEHYPSDVDQRRRQLFPIMRKYKGRQGYKVSLRNDRLTVNGQKYDLDTGLWHKPKSREQLQATRSPAQDPRLIRQSQQSQPQKQLSVTNTKDATTNKLVFETPTFNRYEPLRQHEQQNKQTNIKHHHHWKIL
jgi:hypothetical protein